MKLTIFIGGLSGGGAEHVACNLANYLTQKGHIVELITPSDDEATYPLEKGIRRLILLRQEERRNDVMNQIKRTVRLRRYMRSSDTDEYLVMLPAVSIMLLALHWHTQAPIVFSERSDPEKYSKLLQYSLRYFVRYAKGGAFQTEYALNWYRPYLKGAPVQIIPNAVSQRFTENTTVVEERDRKITAVGRLAEGKNFALLINAFAQIHNDFPSYRLVIYGEGPLRGELEELARQKGVAEYVDMPGYVSDVADKIAESAAYVSSADYEGMSNSTIEAMALGIPCIVTDCASGGPRFLIQSGFTGLLFPPGSEEGLVKALRTVLGDSDLAERLGKNARLIRERLSPETIYAQWEKLFSDVLSNKR